MEVFFKTDCGKLRDHNEDNGGVYSKGNVTLAIIADGMGGHQAGEEASKLAVQSLEEAWSQWEPDQEIEDVTWLEKVVREANLTIYNYADTHPECKGMGTTLVVALCRPTRLTIANVGDSRGYLLDESGLSQITEDHSLVNELVKAGQLSEEDAAYHPRKNVLLRALGTDPQIQVDVFQIDWSESNGLLLCSDGLSNLVNRQEMITILESEKPLSEKAEDLIGCANEAGGNDNISVTLVFNTGGDPE